VKSIPLSTKTTFRIFVDEGLPMAELLSEAARQGIVPEYVGKLLAAMEHQGQEQVQRSAISPQP
jgi:LuxR family transcriptional regulator, maltose regulon positive regulatory protein